MAAGRQRPRARVDACAGRGPRPRPGRPRALPGGAAVGSARLVRRRPLQARVGLPADVDRRPPAGPRVGMRQALSLAGTGPVALSDLPCEGPGSYGTTRETWPVP